MHESEANHSRGHVSKSSSSHRSHRHGDYERLEKHGRHRRRMEDLIRDDLKSMKCKFSPFLVENKPNAYIDWEMKVEQLFAFHNIHKHLKVKLVTLEFSAYALKHENPHCETWANLKIYLRDIFMSSYYARDLFVKLKSLFQGSKNVEVYHKEMEVFMMRVQIVDSQRDTIVRFLHGLNREIQDIVELHHYSAIEDLVHPVTKVESQLKMKFSFRKSYPNASCKVSSVLSAWERGILLPNSKIGGL
ncbi:hypothetical protein CR513_18441, partial [Mucuna pruriens]